MMRAVIVGNGVVTNIAKVEDAEFAGAQGWIVSDVAQIGDIWDGEIFTSPPPPAPTAEEVTAERDRRLEAGAKFSTTGATDVWLQGREQDKAVYLGQMMRANGLKAAGVTSAALRIRAGDNVIWQLTPDQTLDLVAQGMTWFEQVMAVSWAMKDGTGDFTGGIPADFTDDKWWP